MPQSRLSDCHRWSSCTIRYSSSLFILVISLLVQQISTKLLKTNIYISHNRLIQQIKVAMISKITFLKSPILSTQNPELLTLFTTDLRLWTGSCSDTAALKTMRNALLFLLPAPCLQQREGTPPLLLRVNGQLKDGGHYMWIHTQTWSSSPHITLLSTEEMNRAGMRITHWSTTLMGFQYDMPYQPGSRIIVADCLSCVPLSTGCRLQTGLD